MHYLTEKSGAKQNLQTSQVSANVSEADIPESVMEIALEKETIFSQADLWNLQKHMKTIHVTDRFPRTWEGHW